MTYTHLQRIDPAKHMARYYLLSVQPNLLGGHSLIREYGRIGSPGKVRIDLHESESEARTAHEQLVRKKVKRGYGVK